MQNNNNGNFGASESPTKVGNQQASNAMNGLQTNAKKVIV
jgi:hypothetical protein